MSSLGNAGGGRGGQGEPKKMAFMETHAREVEERLQTTRQTIQINNRRAPKLATTWVPFAAYLHDCALKLNDLERQAPPDPDAGLRSLKAHAKLHFLERYRSALWFSSVVWARMADGTPPLPMREFGP